MQERQSPRRKTVRSIKPLTNIVFWRNEHERSEADIYDISLGGCFLNTLGPATNGERITIGLPNAENDGEVTGISGTVVPQRRSLVGFGLKFDELTKDKSFLLID